MKKFLVLVLGLLMALALVGCGGGEGADATPAGSEPVAAESTGETAPEDAGEVADADLTTVEGFLTNFGLSEADLECANFNRLDISVKSAETGEVHEVSTYVSKQLTTEETQAWLEQVVAKLKSLADDGKLSNLLDGGQDLTVDYRMAQELPMATGSYLYEGKTVNFLISVPNGIDNEDPNVAMGACSLKLEYN
jgi:hypothetical protein